LTGGRFPDCFFGFSLNPDESMANLKSSLKDIRRISKRTEANRTVKSRLKTLRKRVLLSEDASVVGPQSTELSSALDKAAKSRVIHRNKANRLKSLAARRLNRLTASAATPAHTSAPVEEVPASSAE
jgi:small subunit ribosomal protein S20